MPFKKVGKKYVSPSGRKYTKKQVIAYYASDGFKKKRINKDGSKRSKTKK